MLGGNGSNHVIDPIGLKWFEESIRANKKQIVRDRARDQWKTLAATCLAAASLVYAVGTYKYQVRNPLTVFRETAKEFFMEPYREYQKENENHPR